MWIYELQNYKNHAALNEAVLCSNGYLSGHAELE